MEALNPSHPPSVLVVDDDAVVLHLLKAYFQKLGWTARFAKTTDEALERLRQAPVSRVLIDIHLNRENGLDLIRRVRAEWPDIRVVAMSGSIDAESGAATTAGATTLLEKPFRSLAAVKEALEQGGAA